MDWLALPPLAALRAFAAFAEAGSYSRAGARLNVSHAAVSQQVRALEDRLGTRLVRRDGRGAALTPEGERLARALEAGFGAIADAVEALSGGDPARPLQITVTPAFAACWLMPRIPGFRRRHPEVELMLNPTAEVVQPAPGGIDVAIRSGAGPWAGLVSEPLVESSYVVVAAPALLAGRAVARPEDLLDLPWLQEYGVDEVATWFASRGVPCPRPERITHLPGHLGLEALRAGAGVCATVRLFVEADIAAGTLCVLFEEERPGWGYHIVTRPGVHRPPLRAFLAWLRAEARPSPAPAGPTGDDAAVPGPPRGARRPSPAGRN